ncbi:MAG: ABC transporter ATP-binding protein [Clostridia bacterium]|nr:ABC transporter ATP-binding protein [Clostridia bacterium]
MMNADKAEVPKRTKDFVEIVPDYDGLFQEEQLSSGKRKSKFLSKIIRINFKPILLSLFIYLFQQLPVLVVPLCTAFIVDEVTMLVEAGGIAVMTGHNWLRLSLAVGIAVLTILINVPATVGRWRVASKVTRTTSSGVRMAMVRKLQSLSITYHKDMQTGTIQAKFLRDMETFDAYMSSLLHGLLLHIITLVGLVAISVIRNGWVSLFFLVVVPVNVILRQAYYKKIRSANRDYRKKAETMSAKLTGMLEMIPVTKAHGLEQTEINAVKGTVKSVQQSGIKMDKTLARFGAWSYVVNNALSVGCLAFCGFLAIKGIISIGDVVLFQTMFTQISGCVSAIVNLMPQLNAGREAIDSLSEIMHVNDVELNMNKGLAPTINGQVEFKDVCYTYPHTEHVVIKDFNLKVNSGECIAVVGSSGSGKTTLINMIIGFLKPTEGDILVDGKSINDYNLSEYRHNISVVPQNSILFSGTIKDNITYGLSHYTQQDLDRVLEMANLNEFIKDLPDGINTNVGEHGDKLSGGQRQRISIARALIRNPQILILDEATSALDNISEFHVQKAIASAIKDRTTFIVAHRLSTIRDADRIVVMEGGVCVETGTYEQLMAKKGKFYELKNLNDLTGKQADNALA